MLFVMQLKTRPVNFTGWTTHRNDAWMNTISLALTNYEYSFLKEKKYLIMDRDTTFRNSFRLDCDARV